MLLKKNKTYNLSIKLELKEIDKEEQEELKSIDRLVVEEGVTLNASIETENKHEPFIELRSMVIAPLDSLQLIYWFRDHIEGYLVQSEQIYYNKLLEELSEKRNKDRIEKQKKMPV